MSKKVSVGPKTINTALNSLKLLPSIINLVNLFGHGASNEEKQAAAMDLAIQAGGVAAQSAADNNPSLRDSLAPIVDAHVQSAKADGTLAVPAPPAS